MKQHSTKNPNSLDPKLAPVFFCFKKSTNQLTSSSKLNHKFDINYINTITPKMPSKNRITRVHFNDASHSANPSSFTATSSRAADQVTYSANATRAPNQPATTPAATSTANPRTILTPTSLALSSNPSTPLTPSTQVPTFEQTYQTY